MSAICPHCGQPMPTRTAAPSGRRLLSAAEVMALLSRGRELYRADDTDQWFVDYGNGETSAAVVAELERADRIRPTYSNTRDSFTAGRTFDVERTVAERKRTGNKHVRIYVGDPLRHGERP